jgi:hypothetical protein
MTACPRCGWEQPTICPCCAASLIVPPVEWSARQMAQFAGVSPRTVQHWHQIGDIGPTHPFPGVDVRLYWGFDDAVALKAFDDLQKGGVPRDIANLAATDIAFTAGRHLLGDADDWPGAEPFEWAIVPLTIEALESVDDRTRDRAALLPYDDSVPPTSVLNERLKPGRWVYPIDPARVAYPIKRAVEEVARRMDTYLDEHHIDDGGLPAWLIA